MKRQEKPEVHLVHTYLSEEDYKNILARIVTKIWYWVLIVLFAIVTGSYILIQKTIEDNVKRIIQKKAVEDSFYEYKKEMLDNANIEFSRIKNQVIEKMRSMQTLPFNLRNGEINFIDEQGESLTVLYGNSTTKKKTYFKKRFNSKPFVFASIADAEFSDRANMSDFPFGSKREKAMITYRRSLNVVETTNSYFVVYYGISSTLTTNQQVSYNWIAIGY